MKLITEIKIVWTADDVQQTAKNMGLSELSRLEVSNILKALERHHDAEYGINWDTIEAEIQNETGRL